MKDYLIELLKLALQSIKEENYATAEFILHVIIQNKDITEAQFKQWYKLINKQE